MVNTLEELEKELVSTKDKIKMLETQKKAMLADVDTNSDTGQMAILLHSKLCKHNHTDGCDWFYGVSKGVHDWKNNYAHREYWQKAKKAQNAGFTVENIKTFFKAIE